MALYMARLNNFHEDFHVETISLKDTVTKNINGLKNYSFETESSLF